MSSRPGGPFLALGPVRAGRRPGPAAGSSPTPGSSPCPATLPALERERSTTEPWTHEKRERADLIAGASTAALVLLKLALEASYLSVGAWLAVILAGGMAYGGYVRSREPLPGTAALPTGSPEATTS